MESSAVAKADTLEILRCEAVYGTSQAVGLLLANLNDGTWIEGESLWLGEGRSSRVWYQYIPTGADASSALRYNMRFDIARPAYSSREMASAYARLMFDPQLQQDCYGEGVMFANCKDEEVAYYKHNP